MAWTTPRTWVANEVVTAALLNEQLRDNMNETLPGRATREGEMFFTNYGSLAARIVDSGFVLTSQATASTSFVDLSTVGPKVTMATGAKALVVISANLVNDTANAYSSMSWGVTGATTSAASDDRALAVDGLAAANTWRAGAFHFIDTLTPGTNTFTAKYRAGGAGTATFGSRSITVWPF